MKKDADFARNDLYILFQVWGWTKQPENTILEKEDYNQVSELNESLVFICERTKIIQIILRIKGGILFFMSEKILEKLFDSPIKVKLLKLFLRNPGRYFLPAEITRKTQGRKKIVKDQLNALREINFLLVKRIKANRQKQIAGGRHFGVNPDFDFYSELQSLVLKSSPTSQEKMLKKIMKLGRIKMALIAGVFLNNENSRLDLFLVGDDISHRKLYNFLAEMEAEVGKEIEYAAMSLKEFDYRFHMFDRFVRDILEKPHETLMNRIRWVE